MCVIQNGVAVCDKGTSAVTKICRPQTSNCAKDGTAGKPSSLGPPAVAADNTSPCPCDAPDCECDCGVGRHSLARHCCGSIFQADSQVCTLASTCSCIWAQIATAPTHIALHQMQSMTKTTERAALRMATATSPTTVMGHMTTVRTRSSLPRQCAEHRPQPVALKTAALA